MTNAEIREVLESHIRAYDSFRSSAFAHVAKYNKRQAEALTALRDRLIAADKLAQAAGTLVNEHDDPAYRSEPDPIKSEMRFWKLREALRAYRSEKGGA